MKRKTTSLLVECGIALYEGIGQMDCTQKFIFGFKYSGVEEEVVKINMSNGGSCVSSAN